MKIDSLDLTNDLIEIVSNPFLKYRPFLLRLTNFSNERYELRLNREQLNDLYNFLGDYVKEQYDE